MASSQRANDLHQVTGQTFPVVRKPGPDTRFYVGGDGAIEGKDERGALTTKPMILTATPAWSFTPSAATTVTSPG